MMPGIRPRVLLADDCAPIRESVRRVLSRSGYDVVDEASDGLRAVELAGTSKPDVAILDLFMAGLNGLKAGAEIHRVSPETRCILLSRSEESYDVAAAMAAGFKGYVAKADAADYLVEAVAEVVRDGVFLSPHAGAIL